VSRDFPPPAGEASWGTEYAGAWLVLAADILAACVARRVFLRVLASHGDDDFPLSVSFSDITNSFRDLA
jgi:hypothetical protein